MPVTIANNLDHDFIVAFGGKAATKPVYKKPDRAIVGGKGLGLQEMARLEGVDVPPGFTLTTPLCQAYQNLHDLPPEVWSEVRKAVHRLEKDMGKIFGDPHGAPLLLSCRSGAAISMPGMMDTVLNIGLNSETVKGLAKSTGNPHFAYDSYRRLLDMFGDVVLGIPHDVFEHRLEKAKKEAGVVNDVDLDVDALKSLVEDYKDVYVEHHLEFPEDPFDQLEACVRAVFGSWNSARAIKYREINDISGLLGTAANIQAMVFGNMGDTSGTGVAFSRDPGTGEKRLFGEYLINAQGEDVVAGIRTPQPISGMAQVLPKAYEQFVRNMAKLEQHFADMQDVEFTVEGGHLWMLQCRSGKRTGPAAFKIAKDMVDEGLCTPEQALLKIEPDHVRQILHPTFPAKVVLSDFYKSNVVAKGLPAGPGAAVGKIVFNSSEAEAMVGEKVIIVRENTSPEDVGGMFVSAGILTSRGGMTSHAAVVARGWGKPCIVGCGDLEIDDVNHTVKCKTTGDVFRAGDVISLNGSTGEVIKVPIEMATMSMGGDLGVVLGWADKVEGALKVLANADSGPDATKAAELGAQGIGLCRTEHQFFTPPERLPVVRRWILQGSEESLRKIQEFQRSDFFKIFRAMNGKPVTIRLLDPPLHEFLPKPDQVNEAMATELGFGTDTQMLLDKIESMDEVNPMLGLRGCRLAIVRSELAVIQTEAAINAAADLIEDDANLYHPKPRIMIPLVGNLMEFELQAKAVRETAERVKKDRGINVPYEIGTMMEVPRATLIADQIAALKADEGGSPLCSFFSYGTNDLTQMTFGISRDDSATFISKYVHEGIMEHDPFVTVDEEGVGFLIRKSAMEGRSTNPRLSLSVCGEHGGDPLSIAFFDQVGLDYVSCSPFRVPIARLAVAQAAIKRSMKVPKPIGTDSTRLGGAGFHQ